MKQRIDELRKSLAFLGYGGFEIRCIVKDALGHEHVGRMNNNQGRKVVRHLEKYERLGRNYVRTYSK